MNPSENSLPNEIKYKLRKPIDPEKRLGPEDWFTKNVFPTFQRSTPRTKDDSDFKPEYYSRRYLRFQYAIDKAIIKTLKPNFDPTKYKVKVQKILHPPYVDNPFILVVQNQLPFIVLLSFILIVPSIVKDIALEKEKRLKVKNNLTNIFQYLNGIYFITGIHEDDGLEKLVTLDGLGCEILNFHVDYNFFVYPSVLR